MPRSSKAKRAFTPGAVAPGRPEAAYRSPMHLEQQKFKTREAFCQLYFKSEGHEPAPAVLETFGMDLNVGQAKALAAVQILLHDSGFKGHKIGTATPELVITPSQYYEAYGLEKTNSGGYGGHQREEAMADLQSLTESRRVVYQRRRWTGRGDKRQEVSDVVLKHGSLIGVAYGYEGLSQAEADAIIKAGADPAPDPDSVMVISCGSVLLDQIDRHYVLKWRDLFKEIQALYPGKRQPRGVSLLVEYLWTLDIPEFTVHPDKLVEKVGLGYLIRDRRRTPAMDKLRQYIEHATTLGYLKSWRLDEWSNYVLVLNPAKCSRVWHTLKSAEKAERLKALASGIATE